MILERVFPLQSQCPGRLVGGGGQSGWLLGTVFVEGSNCSSATGFTFHAHRVLAVPPDNGYMYSAWFSEVSAVTAVSSLAGTSRTEGSFRLPSANEEKLQMRNRAQPLLMAGLCGAKYPKSCGSGNVRHARNERILGRTILGAGGK